jgi:hypothetical protein
MIHHEPQPLSHTIFQLTAPCFRLTANFWWSTRSRFVLTSQPPSLPPAFFGFKKFKVILQKLKFGITKTSTQNNTPPYLMP